jgi:hypothetical protein
VDELRQQMGAIHATVELTAARADFAKTMCLLRALKAGTVRIEQVVIDGESWSVLDPTQTPVLIQGEG